MNDLTVGRASPVTDGNAPLVAMCFADRIPAVIDEYQRRLKEVRSPLISGDAWRQSEVHVRRILDDCLHSLTTEVMTISDTDVFQLGADRVRQGIHLIHSMRAASILLDVTLVELTNCMCPESTSHVGLMAAVRALHSGIGLRLESVSAGYDAFLLQRVHAAHEQGQHRLAREVHDHIGNSVSLALRRIELYELECERAGMTSVPRHIQLAKDAILETISHSRELVTMLRRQDLTGSLEIALRGFAASLGDSGTPLQISVLGEHDHVPAAVTEELFVMIRECLRNAHTHADADDVVCQIIITPTEIRAKVTDNGKGFDANLALHGPRGNGLRILHERSRLVGGSVDIDSAPHRGTRVTLVVPLTDGGTSTA